MEEKIELKNESEKDVLVKLREDYLDLLVEEQKLVSEYYAKYVEALNRQKVLINEYEEKLDGFFK